MKRANRPMPISTTRHPPAHTIHLRAAVHRFLGALALLAVLIGAYCFAIRPGQLLWGAIPDEVNRSLPGDDLISAPTFYSTRGVTIAGRPEDIWPWIVQIGYGRAGFYGYDLIENLGSPRGIPSARSIVPELQNLAAGDRVYMSGIAYLVVHSMAPNRYLIWAGAEKPPGGAFTFDLYPIDKIHTRLLLRIRWRHHWTDRRILLDLFTEFADHVAVPKMLLGIKDRVEGRGIEPLWIQGVRISVWLMAFLEFVIAFVLALVRERWRLPWMVALLAGFVLQFVLYAQQPIWIGASLDILLLAVLVWVYSATRPHPADRGLVCH